MIYFSDPQTEGRASVLEQPGCQQDPTSPATLRVIPLGGLGEFGKNIMVLEYEEDLIVVDCGMKFPEEDMLGVDIVIPDFSYIADNRDRFRGLILTHGHEDHIGSAPYLWRALEEGFPIYGAELTLAMAASKFDEMGLGEDIEYEVVEPGQQVELGKFRVEFLHVDHSLPKAMALAIHLPIGIVVHTGDYKLGPAESFPEPASLEAFARQTRPDEILLLIGDSTNIEREGISPGEEEVRVGLEEVIRKAARTVIVATFSSSLYRVQTILDLAEKLDRKVAICGYSLERNFQLASQLGILDVSPDLVLPLRDWGRLPAHRRLMITTGTQGEPLSALSRLALNTHKGYKVEEGDLVVMSSRIIPGNEKAIYRMINHFYSHGARVVTEREARVHASGHAYRGEIRRLVEQLHPRNLMPVHGELRQQIEYRDMAVEAGMPPHQVHVLENGWQLELTADRGFMQETDWAGQVLVDGKMLDEVEEVVLRDRKHLAEDGMITVILVIDSHSHEIAAGPDLITRGFVQVDISSGLLEDCRRLVIETFHECNHDSQEDWGVVKAEVRKALRRYLRHQTDRYPMILPVVVEI